MDDSDSCCQSAGWDSCSDQGSFQAYEEDSDSHAGAQQPRPRTCTIITPVELAHVQAEALASVTSILGCTRSTARKLLIHSRWDTEALFGSLADKGEERLFSASGVSMPAESSASPAGELVTCNICFSEVAGEESTAMDCGHRFCNCCWQSHLAVQISEGKSRRLRCMAVSCSAHCDEDKVQRLLEGDEVLLGKYRESLLRSYVEDNAMVRWCPSVPHCGNALRADEDPHCEPTCSCGLKFCFACGDEPHSPCTCDMWRQWKQKCQDDSETRNWLTANTKPCPKCGKPVEKSGGCNLVVCHCGQSFCWLCGAPTGRNHTWTEIYGHSCGRYKDDVDKKIDEAARNVKRYQHYHTRWEAHARSARAEGHQRVALKQKMSVLEDSNSTLKDYTWLLQALDQLFEARKILGYSYAFAFFMFGQSIFKEEISDQQNAINQNLFENQQQEMESLVEHMSLKLGMPAEKMEVEESLRLEIINHTVNLDKRLRKLYELIETDLLGGLVISPNEIAPYKGYSSAAAGRSEVALNMLAHTEAAAASQTPSPLPVVPTTGPSKRARIDRRQTGLS